MGACWCVILWCCIVGYLWVWLILIIFYCYYEVGLWCYLCFGLCMGGVVLFACWFGCGFGVGGWLGGWFYLIWVFVVWFVWFTDLRLCGLLRVVWLVYVMFGLGLLALGLGFIGLLIPFWGGVFCDCIWLLVMLFVVGVWVGGVSIIYYYVCYYRVDWLVVLLMVCSCVGLCVVCCVDLFWMGD